MVVDAGEVEIEHAGQARRIGRPVEQRVVAEQVGVHRAARQRLCAGGGVEALLEVQFLVQALCERRAHVRAHDGHRLRPPVDAAQVGLLHRVIEGRRVQMRQRDAQQRAVRQHRRVDALAGQQVHQRRRLAGDRVQEVARRIGARLGHRQALARQVLHQAQIERELLEAEALEHRQHPVALVGVHEVVGVLDAAGAAAHRGERAGVQRAQQRRRRRDVDFRVDSHQGIRVSVAPTRASRGAAAVSAPGTAQKPNWNRRMPAPLSFSGSMLGSRGWIS